VPHYRGRMAELLSDCTWTIQGRTVTLPVSITHAESAVAVYAAPADAAAEHLRGTELEPWTVGGRALSVLLLVHYDEWELGTYDEVGVGLLVTGPGLKAGLHVLDLPVTGAFTCEAGQDLWGLPKWMMRAELEFHGRRARVVVHDGPEFVMEAELTAGRVPVPPRTALTLPVWSRPAFGAQAGRLLRGTMPVRVSAATIGRGNSSVQLGVHPMALRMADLGMTGRPLMVVHAGHATGSLGPFAAVGGERPRR
jgi:Acetoacetate decarboxylase (ADC).